MGQAPWVRDAPQIYRLGPMSFLQEHSDVLERLAVEMYACGFSAQEIEHTLVDATGDRPPSCTVVNQVTEAMLLDSGYSGTPPD